MGDRMTPIPFSKLMSSIIEEYRTKGTVFGVRRPYRADKEHTWRLFDGKLETPFGPAAGPHTQLAQNIVAAYFAGSRFFELKTVQILDGEDLPVSKPCIRADDECYNVEWSTELYVPQAFDEYVKAWFALHVMAGEFKLGGQDGFQFNMSVGYDLEGIKSAKIDKFIEGLKDARSTGVFKECESWLSEHSDMFKNLNADDIKKIPSEICKSVTLSTLHGCPPQEIERIARYLLEEKKVHTFVKCNPTLLGYEYARKVLDDMGYGYVSFTDFHFKDDLQYEDAVPMLRRLKESANALDLEFGVKITNTFPVDIKSGELPGNEMYMSGKALFPLSMAVAAKLSSDFGGSLRISYSGGADYFNIEKIVSAGIWPVTMATTLLKPGGYQRLLQIAEVFGGVTPEGFSGVDADAVAGLAEKAKTDRHLIKAVKPLPSRKAKGKAPLLDCFFAPCEEGCPIHQDITAYMKLAGEGKMKEALKVITDKNPLPFITGTICAHNCMGKCTRNFYETPVNIRRTKLEAARGGFIELMKEIGKPEATSDKKAAVVGGGPAGLAAAYFLSRGGLQVTLFEKRESLGGVVRSVIPDFRISGEAIDNDIKLVLSAGVRVITGKEIKSVSDLKKDYDCVILAVGASEPGTLKLEQGETVNALEFLEEFKKNNGRVDIGKNVVVIGGGNTAMDTARAAKRTAGVNKVSLVYRRTKRYMPADEEELALAVDDCVEFLELLSPVTHKNGVLTCKKMALGEPGADGRRAVAETGETVSIEADTIIAAVGEKIPSRFYGDNGVNTASVDKETMETPVKGIFVIGDGLNGPATVVEAIRDARKASDAILDSHGAKSFDKTVSTEAIYDKRGRLAEEDEKICEVGRCLSCSSVCESCSEVCPNRANISVKVPGMEKNQIVHVDYMCNECGNCRSFCPYEGAPYLDKFTLFANEADMKNSKNEGFTVIDRESGDCKVRLKGEITDYKCGVDSPYVPKDIGRLIEAVASGYKNLI